MILTGSGVTGNHWGFSQGKASFLLWPHINVTTFVTNLTGGQEEGTAGADSGLIQTRAPILPGVEF